MMKKTAATLLILCLMLTLLPSTALAAAVEVSNKDGLIAAINVGGEITLTGYISLTDVINISKDVTLNLNKFSIYNGNSTGIFTVSGNANLTINDIGGIEGGPGFGNRSGSDALVVYGNGNVTINSGVRIVGGNGSGGGNGGHALKVADSADGATITINGGSLTGGKGGSSDTGDGGNGGCGLRLEHYSGNTITVAINDGSVTGGKGGNSATATGGVGGDGIFSDYSVAVSCTNNSSFSGGEKGTGSNGVACGGNATISASNDIVIFAGDSPTPTNIHNGNYSGNDRYVRTEAARYGITLSPSGDHDFGAMAKPYTSPEHIVTVTNTGNNPTGNLTAALSGTNASSFTVSPASIPSIAVGGSASFTVKPNDSLDCNSYSAIVSVAGAHISAQTFNVTFTVKLSEPSNLAWDAATPGKATWGAVGSANEYSVQLLKNGTEVMTVHNIPSTNNYHDFMSIIQANGTGSYQFKVKATHSSTPTCDSDLSDASGNYNYSTPVPPVPPTPPTPVVPGGVAIASIFDQKQNNNTVTVYNAPSPASSTIWLSGAGLKANDTLVTQRAPAGSEYNALLKLADGSAVFNTYNISLKSGLKSTGSPMYLTFDLDAKYAGQQFTLVHQKADGTYEYFYATADANGDVSFGALYELSPFMLVKGTLAQQNVTVPNAVVPNAAVIPPQTGDGGTVAGWAMIFLAAGLAVTVTARRRRRSK